MILSEGKWQSCPPNTFLKPFSISAMPASPVEGAVGASDRLHPCPMLGVMVLSGRYGSVGWRITPIPKGFGFDSQSGHIPRLQV